jgi:hypothetical protein
MSIGQRFPQCAVAHKRSGASGTAARKPSTSAPGVADALTLRGRHTSPIVAVVSSAPLPLRSVGFCHFRDHLSAYQHSEGSEALQAETDKLRRDLSRITYRVQIEGARITVSRYVSEPDYAEVVVRTFEKFRQGADSREAAAGQDR